MVQVERKHLGEIGREGKKGCCQGFVGSDQQHKASAPLELSTHTYTLSFV